MCYRSVTTIIEASRSVTCASEASLYGGKPIQGLASKGPENRFPIIDQKSGLRSNSL